MTRTMYDSSDPAKIPDWDHMVAGYQHGWPGWLSPDFIASHVPAQARRLILIDNTGATPLTADVLDVETGAASIARIPGWLEPKRERGWWSAIYCSASNLPAVRQAAAGYKCVFWVANWALNEAEAIAQLGGDIVACQWASPTSNRLPGYDRSVVNDTWFAAPASVPASSAVLDAAHTVAKLAGQLDQAAHALVTATAGAA